MAACDTILEVYKVSILWKHIKSEEKVIHHHFSKTSCQRGYLYDTRITKQFE